MSQSRSTRRVDRIRSLFRGRAPIALASASVVEQLEKRRLLSSTIVNWDGDYVSSVQNLARSNAGANVDYEGDADNDRRQRYAFSDSAPLNPSSNYTITAGNSGTFYGGGEFWRLDSTSSFSAQTFAVQDGQASDGGDTITFHQTNQANRRQFAAVLWKKEDFLASGLSGETPVAFDETSSLSLNVATNANNHHTWRFMVQSAGQYYLSSFVAQDDATLTGTALVDTTWAAYDPASDLRPNPGTGNSAGTLTFDTATAEFTNITAVGFFAQAVGGVAQQDRVFRVEAFSTSATSALAAPAAPSNLVATATRFDRVELAWVDNSDDEDAFVIERALDPNFSSGYQTFTVPANATSFVDTGLTESTTYHYRLSALNPAGASAFVTANASTPLNSPRTIVNWDGDYVSSVQNLARSNAGANVDYEGDADNDRRQRYAFSDSAPLNPSNNYTVTAGNSGTFYGGGEFWRLDSTSSFSAQTFAVQDGQASDGGDTITFHQTNQANRRQFAAVLWKKEDFLDADLNSIAPAGLSGNSSLTLDVATNANNHHTWRFMVQSAGQYYLSSFVAQDDATLTGTALVDTTWAAYDPASDLRPNPGTGNSAGTLTFDTATSELTNITAVGFFAQAVGGVAQQDRVFRIERFEVTAVEATSATPPTVPAAPSGLAATAVSSSQVNLSWVDVATNEAGYVLERASNSAFTSGVTSINLPLSTTAYSDSGLDPSTTYYYRVRAVNSAGSSAYSATASATTQSGVQLPDPPSDLAASAFSSSRIDLTWTDNADNELSFEVDRSTNSSFTAGLATFTVGANVTSYSSTGLAAATTYYFRVRATNTAGDSADSPSASATTQTGATAPAAPSNLIATAGGTGTINLTWTDNSLNETGFEIDRATNSSFTSNLVTLAAGANATSYSNSGLSASTTYYYRVRATNAVNDSANSNTSSATTAAPSAIAAPNGLYATPLSKNIIELRWLDNSGNETGFRIERGTSAAGPFTQVGSVGADTTSYRNTGLSSATAYYYRVRATDGTAFSSYTAVTSATTTAAGDEVIVDEDGPGVSIVGNWNGGYLDANTAWAGKYEYDRDNTTNAASATFNLTIPADGRYDLLHWVPKNNGQQDVPLEVTHAGGTTTIYIDQREENTGSWILGGAFDFIAGPTTSVLRDAPGISLKADAFRLVRSPTAAPAAPTGLTASAVGPGRINLFWNDIAGNERNYVIERSFDGTNWTQIALAAENANNHVVSGLTQTTTYHFRVRAMNSVGSSAYSNTASATTSEALHRRLWLATSQVNALKQAITVNGSHHREAYLAMKARVDTGAWQTYDENPNDGNWNYARAALAREASLMYLLTDNAAYATTAYNALASMYTNPDPDNRLPDGGYNNSSNADLSRAQVGLGFAVTYDWAYNGLTTPQRDFIRSKIVSSLDKWPNVGVPNDSPPRVSNHVGAARSAELIMILSVNEEESRASRTGYLKNRVREHILGAYGPSGWTQEGTGYADFAGMFMVPAVAALRSVGDDSLDTAFDSRSFWKIPMYAYSGLIKDSNKMRYVLQSGVDNGAPLNQEGWMSAMLATVPAAQMPYYRWYYDQILGINSPADASEKFDYRRAGTTWAVAFYPTSGSSVDPDGNLPLTLSDDTRGVYYFRNRFQNTDDILISSMADVKHDDNAWDSPEAFQLNLIAYGNKFIGGAGKQTTAPYFSTLLVDGKNHNSTTHTGTKVFYSAESNGGGYLIAGGGSKYSNLGLSSAQRHTLVDFDGHAAPAVLSTLDRITDESSHTYTWQLNLGDEVSNLGLTVSTGTESGRPYFIIHGVNGAYVKGWVLSHTDATINAPVGENDPLAISVSGSTTDLWVAMVVGQGTAPTGSITGSGLGTQLRVNDGLISFDATSNRILSAYDPNTQQPAAPGNLVATTVSKTRIDLAWVDNATNETSYLVERRTGTGAWSQIAQLPAGAVAFQSTGLGAGTNYTYRVRASNSNGFSSYSNESVATTTTGTLNTFDELASSPLGDAGNNAIRGSAIMADGTVVLAANIGTATPGGLTPILLNGATATSGGAIVRLSADGATVLSVTRVADRVWDLSTDSSDNLYLATNTGGAIKLNATADQLVWVRNTHQADRIDVAPNGDVAVLDQSLNSDGITPNGNGQVHVYNAGGTLLGSFAGHNRTYDVAIDETTQSVFLTGYKQATGPSGNPVQIAYLKSQSYTGSQNWKAYDWTSTQVDNPAQGGTGPTNNMADTRGLRLDMGADEKLYVAYMSAGGNHIFRYSPFNLFQTVSIVGGDQYHQFFNSASEHKTFFARYEPATGAYLRGQQLTARLATGQANTLTLDNGGDIQADEQGRVYISGFVASGGGTNNTLPGLPYTHNPVSSSEYGGGAFMMIMNADFTQRLYVGRVASDSASGGVFHTIATRTLAGETTARTLFGGQSASSNIWSQNPIQDEEEAGLEGVLTLLYEG